jgi:hypothetical protein
MTGRYIRQEFLKTEIVQVLLILNFQNLFYYMKANMWNGFTKCCEKFYLQVVRGKGMMCGVNDG